jgi:hypothetical protein
MVLSCIMLGLFALVAGFDGLYFHWFRFRLFERAESRYEHYLHTANACLFPAQVFLLFCVRPYGAWLSLATLITAASFAIEMFDVYAERESRKKLGGLITSEYALHFLMSGLRAAYVFAFYATHELSDFAATASLQPVDRFYRYFGLWILLPSIGIALAHIRLCFVRYRAGTATPTFLSASPSD